MQSRHHKLADERGSCLHELIITSQSVHSVRLHVASTSSCLLVASWPSSLVLSSRSAITYCCSTASGKRHLIPILQGRSQEHMGRKRCLPDNEAGFRAEGAVPRSLEQLVRLQEQGRVCYGDYLCPTERRSKQSLPNPVIAHLLALQGDRGNDLPRLMLALLGKS